MKLKEYKNLINPENKWAFLVWFIRTKEFHYILIGIFVLLVIFMLISPESVIKLKMLLWNYLLGKLK